MEDLYLVYINKIGQNWKGEFMYEFLFSFTKENADNEDWDSYPARSGNPEPPDFKFIKEVGLFNTSMDIVVIQESEGFSLFDAVDGIVAMAYENLENYDDYPDNRLYFHFGDTQKKVDDKLYERDIVLKYEKTNKHV